MKIKGSVIISKATGDFADGAHQKIHITIEDETSGCRILEAYMALEEFAKAVTASYGEADIELYEKAPVGKKREWKQMTVPFKSGLYRQGTEAARIAQDEALAPFEVGGWKADRNDLYNFHKWVGGPDYHSVTFVRYVEGV